MDAPTNSERTMRTGRARAQSPRRSPTRQQDAHRSPARAKSPAAPSPPSSLSPGDTHTPTAPRSRGGSAAASAPDTLPGARAAAARAHDPAREGAVASARAGQEAHGAADVPPPADATSTPAASRSIDGPGALSKSLPSPAGSAPGPSTLPSEPSSSPGTISSMTATTATRRDVADEPTTTTLNAGKDAGDAHIPVAPPPAAAQRTSPSPTTATHTPSAHTPNAASSLDAPSTDAHAPLAPEHLLGVLCCPICLYALPQTSDLAGRLLAHPTTLRCGHTVCRAHLASPSSARGACPIPTCPSRTAAPQPDAHTLVHPAAHVGFVPAPQGPHPEAHPRSADAAGELARVDVTVSKVIGLVRRACEAQRDEETQERVQGWEDDEGTDDEHEDDHASMEAQPEAGPSSPRRPRPQDESDRPRKRRRISPRHPRRSPQAQSRDDADSAGDEGGRFEKELLAELTCEICFALLWQPVTTPCQHVSPSLPSLRCAPCAQPPRCEASRHD